MLSSQMQAQGHFQIRVCSAMGGGRESKGSLAARNLVLSSVLNSPLAAGQAFKVERFCCSCFRYIPSVVNGLKVKWLKLMDSCTSALYTDF